MNFTGTSFSGNAATGTNIRGGGIYVSAGNITAEDISVTVNRAAGSGSNGGGIFLEPAGTYNLTDISVTANQPNNCGNPSTILGCS
jgi:hypothetical protein